MGRRDARSRCLSRAASAAVASALFALVVAVGDGCILVEPAADLPELPLTRPTILRGSVVPSASSVLTVFPSELIVPVELVDATRSFDYAVFVDYNPSTGEGLLVPAQTSNFAIGNTVERTRVLSIALSTPPDLDRCHVIEVVVALRLESGTSAQATHTPAEPGGDLVTWFYNPNGDLGGCPTLDAGFDAPFDAGEAGDAGDAGGDVP